MVVKGIKSGMNNISGEIGKLNNNEMQINGAFDSVMKSFEAIIVPEL